MFDLLFGDGYTKEELSFINEVLVEIKEQSGGNVHVTFDYAGLLEDFREGKTAQEIANDTFGFLNKIKSGEIKTKPYTDDVERYSIEDYESGNVPEGKSCGPNCECYPQK